MDMNVAFWNIGKALPPEKEQLLEQAIKSLHPEIFTIAEGTRGKLHCQKVTAIFDRLGYDAYYTPLFSDQEDLDLKYPYNSNGLKVFVKRDAGFTFEKFDFEDQKEQGRIITLKVYWKFKAAVIVFIHNLSKGGGRLSTINQNLYIKSLSDMIQYAIKPTIEDPLASTAKDRIFIMGDFNLEPWDELLRNEKLLMSSYFKNRNLLDLRKDDRLYFFNPLVELMHTTTNPNLLGTFFGNTSGWALFDYILYPTVNATVKFDIITELGPGHKLLNDNLDIVKDFLDHELDHLPIKATIE
jgi:hypothetical protein